MKRILFPVEINENQNNSFVYAAKLAHFFNAELILLNSYPSFEAKENFNQHQEYIRKNIFKLNENIESLKKHYLERFSPIGDYLQIKMEYRYKEGNLMHHIFSACENENIDLITFTLYNHRSQDERHARSLVNKFSTKKVDLLIVPEDSYFLHLSSILYATDFESSLSIQSLKRIYNLTKRLKTNIHILHNHMIAKDSEEFQYLKFLKKNSKELEIHNAKNIIEIMHYCYVNEPNLMIIQKKERSFFEKIFKESFAQKVLIQTKVPLIILMDK
ncbi:MAG: hypothetical protein KAI79_08970 [Bacteroidales bacterium]|nr:hypothetical protein [Bacteroidales bacterium]